MGVQARKCRQQGGVNVQQPLVVVLHKARCQNPHEAREHHQEGLVRVDQGLQGRIKGLTRLRMVRKIFVAEHGRGNAVFLRKRQAPSIGPVADDSGHPRLVPVFPSLPLRGLDDGRHVRSAA